MSYEDQIQEAIKRSLGLDQTEGQQMDQEMTEDKKVNAKPMTSDSNTSDGTSSDSSSTSTSSDSEDQVEQPTQPALDLEEIAKVAQTVIGDQMNQPGSNLGNLIE